VISEVKLMPEFRHADSFRDLVVYQKARKAAQSIFRFSTSFPKEETYSLTDQLRRSSRSVGAQNRRGVGETTV
jgi:hypothetical protein